MLWHLPIANWLVATAFYSLTPTPHLLTVPREIRDQIYSHLHRKIQLHHTPLRDVALRIDVSLKNTPLISVLLMHPRLRAEYTQSPSFKKLSLKIDDYPVFEPDDIPAAMTEHISKHRLALQLVLFA
jgi:hypothetical protein